MHPGARDGVHIDVGHNQVLFERPSAGDRPSGLIDHKTIAVEDQFILASDEIDVGNRNKIIHGARREHFLPDAQLPSLVGRRADVDDRFRVSNQGLSPRWTLRIPDIFTNIDTQRDAVEDDGQTLASRLEIPVLIKHTVIGKTGLMLNGHDPLIADKGGGVIEIYLPIHKAHHGGNPPNLCGELIEDPDVVGNKRGPQQQIFRRVPGQCQLRKDHEIRLRLLRRFHCIKD